MTDRLQALPLWLRVSAILLLCVIAVVPLIAPMIIIGVKYSNIHTAGAMPAGYWLLLLWEPLGCLILKFAFRNAGRFNAAYATLMPPGQQWRRLLVIIFNIAIFGLMAIKSNADGYFNSMSLFVVSANVALAILILPVFVRKEAIL